MRKAVRYIMQFLSTFTVRIDKYGGLDKKEPQVILAFTAYLQSYGQMISDHEI